MTSASIVLVLLAGLVGIMLWIIGVIALDVLRDGHRTHDNRHGTTGSEQYDGYKAPGPHRASHRL